MMIVMISVECVVGGREGTDKVRGPRRAKTGEYDSINRCDETDETPMQGKN